MKKLKLLQAWPLLHNGKEFNCGDVAEFEDTAATWLLEHQRAEPVESSESGDKNDGLSPSDPKTSEQEDQTARQAKIQAAVAEMLTADPAATPKCPEIAAKTGLFNIRKEERDAAVAAYNQAKNPDNKGE